MRKSFCWWQCSDRYMISLFPHLHMPCPWEALWFLWTLSTMFTQCHITVSTQPPNRSCAQFTIVKHCIWKIAVCTPCYSEYTTPNMSHTPLSNDRSSSSGGSSIKGEGVCVGVGGEILLINIVTLSPPINSKYWNPALQQFPTTKASKSTITMLHPLDRSNPNPPPPFFFCWRCWPSVKWQNNQHDACGCCTGSRRRIRNPLQRWSVTNVSLQQKIRLLLVTGWI